MQYIKFLIVRILLPAITLLIIAVVLTESESSELMYDKNGVEYALLIGIDTYHCKSFPDLTCPSTEMMQLATIFNKSGYVTHLIKNPTATTASIIDSLKILCSHLNTNDRILVYFSGHAVNYAGLCATMEQQIRDSAFAYEKTSVSKSIEQGAIADFLFLIPEQKEGRFTEAISANTVAEMLNGCKARQKILIIDACFSGVLRNPFYQPLGSSAMTTIEDGFFAMTTGREATNDGLVSSILLKGLRGQADSIHAGNKDGFVSLYELTVYIDAILRTFGTQAIGNPSKYQMRYMLIGSGDIRLNKY